MSSASFTAGWTCTGDGANRYPLRIATPSDQDERLAAEIVKKIEAATVSGKLDFFRSMGLAFSNGCDINYNNKNENSGNACDLQTSCERPCENIVESSTNKAAMAAVSWGSKSKGKHSISQDGIIYDDISCQKTTPLLRDCRVTIIGEKCKICARSFQCITDLALHTRKKHHHAKKSRKKLVIKIGDEVITRVPIKRKHLKCLHKRKERTIDSLSGDNDVVASLWRGDIFSGGRTSEEETTTTTTTPIVDPNSNCDRSMSTDEIPWPRLMDIDFSPQEPYDEAPTLDDEEIEILLKITRPQKSIDEMEINHETPNRSERERLLVDAICDFVTMDDDVVEIIEPARDLQVYRDDDSGLIEEYDVNRQFGNLNGEERNCSFHISNEDDICPRDVNSLLPGDNGNQYAISNDAASIHSPHYRNENGDIIPDFIDYTHCLNDRPPYYNSNSNNNVNNNHNNNNKNNNNVDVGEFDSLYYNESRGDKWDGPTCDMRITNLDVQENPNLCVSLSLIKEEIMLDEVLR